MGESNEWVVDRTHVDLSTDMRKLEDYMFYLKNHISLSGHPVVCKTLPFFLYTLLIINRLLQIARDSLKNNVNVATYLSFLKKFKCFRKWLEVSDLIDRVKQPVIWIRSS